MALHTHNDVVASQALDGKSCGLHHQKLGELAGEVLHAEGEADHL